MSLLQQHSVFLTIFNLHIQMYVGKIDGVKYKTDEQRPRPRIPEAGIEGPAAFNFSGGGGVG